MKTSLQHFVMTLAYWCFCLAGPTWSLERLIKAAKDRGAYLDLVPYKHWPEVIAAGVKMSCVLPEIQLYKAGEKGPELVAPFERGFNSSDEHQRLAVFFALSDALDRAKANSIPYIIVFTGMDTGEARDVQYQRIVEGFTTRIGGAEESLMDKANRLGITFIIEMLNTKGDPKKWWGHPGYLGNNTRELIEQVVRKIRSARFRLAFDVYHCALMGEDILVLIKEFGVHIGYVHLAGCLPGDVNRAELTLDGQSIDFRAIGAELAKVVPAGTFALAEYIPTAYAAGEVDQHLDLGFATFASRI